MVRSESRTAPLLHLGLYVTPNQVSTVLNQLTAVIAEHPRVGAQLTGARHEPGMMTLIVAVPIAPAAETDMNLVAATGAYWFVHSVTTRLFNNTPAPTTAPTATERAAARSLMRHQNQSPPSPRRGNRQRSRVLVAQ